MEKEKTVDAIDVANYVIKYLKKRGKSVNHLKLQKLLYYIEAWHLVFFDSPIFSEDIKAWQHGPVLESVWHHLKKYSILYNELEACEECESDLSDEQKDLINDVLDEYGDKTGYYLENLTHEEEPWQKAWASADKTLDKELMKTYYGARLDASKQAKPARWLLMIITKGVHYCSDKIRCRQSSRYQQSTLWRRLL